MSYTGPVLSKLCEINFSTSFFASCHISIFFLYLSSSDKSPSLKFDRTTSALFLASSMIAFFSSGTFISSIPHVMPACVAYLNPRVLILSRIEGILSISYLSIKSSISLCINPMFTSSLTNG